MNHIGLPLKVCNDQKWVRGQRILYSRVRTRSNAIQRALQWERDISAHTLGITIVYSAIYHREGDAKIRQEVKKMKKIRKSSQVNAP